MAIDKKSLSATFDQLKCAIPHAKQRSFIKNRRPLRKTIKR